MTTSLRYALLDTLPHQARRVLQVTGEDALRFLQGLLSADVGELTPGRLTPAVLLTIKGKVVSEVWVAAASEDEPWLLIPEDLADAVIASLDAHIIMDDVELEVLEGHACALVWGASGADPKLPAPSGAAHPGAVNVFMCTHPLAGRLLIGPPALLRSSLEQDELESGDEVTFTRARVEQARPAWGHELAAGSFPPEIGFVDAVSYTKGCFMGQEPLSRIHNRGQVNRVMVRVRATGRPPGDTSVELSEGEGRVVGQWTSWVSDDVHDVHDDASAVTGLAIVKRKFAEPGTRLRAGEIDVEVCSAPLGDDPGRGGASGGGKSATVSLGGRR